MTEEFLDSYEAFRQMEYTRAALSTLAEMTGALMAQGDEVSRHAIGFEVLMDTQNEKLKQIEDSLRHQWRNSARHQEVQRSFEEERDRYRREKGSASSSDLEASSSQFELTPNRVQEIAAELRLNPETVQRVIEQLQATRHDGPYDEGAVA